MATFLCGMHEQGCKNVACIDRSASVREALADINWKAEGKLSLADQLAFIEVPAGKKHRLTYRHPHTKDY
jgi:hypothetical protein